MKKLNFIVLTILLITPIITSAASKLKDFSTDGCSMWIDQYRVIDDISWSHCCIQHDIRYYGGGDRTQRKTADKELKSCIKDVGAPKMAKIIYLGVRSGGGPYSLTFYRWGYGWKRNRFYKTLSKEQKALVNEKTKGIDIYDLDQIEYRVTTDPDDLYL